MTGWLAIAWVMAVSSFQGTIDENLAERRLIGVCAAVGVSLRGLQFGAAAAGSLASRTGAGALVWAVLAVRLSIRPLLRRSRVPEIDVCAGFELECMLG